MLINLRTISEEHSSQSSVVHTSEKIGFWPSGLSDITCTAEIDLLGTQVIVELSYQCSIQLECARCLSVFSQPIADQVHLLLDLSSKRQGADDDSADYFYNADDEAVDVSQSLYDEILLNLPMKPICREDCMNLDLSTGSASQQPSDERWAALYKLGRKPEKT